MLRLLPILLLLAITSSAAGQDVTVRVPVDSVDVPVGETMRIDAIIRGSGPLPMNWESLDTEIATVFRDGGITGIKPGQTTVTLTVKDVTVRIHVTVVPAEIRRPPSPQDDPLRNRRNR